MLLWLLEVLVEGFEFDWRESDGQCLPVRMPKSIEMNTSPEGGLLHVDVSRLLKPSPMGSKDGGLIAISKLHIIYEG